jgi:uncharacterized protein (TIGR02246 family)
VRAFKRLTFLTGLAMGGHVHAQDVTPAAAAGAQRDITAWVDGWNQHDARALGDILSPHVNFVLVNGIWLRGRDEFVRVHATQFAGRYHASVFAIDGTPTVTSIGVDVAVVQWRWTISGVHNEDGTPAPLYRGVFTWVLSGANDRWQVEAAQNTVKP